MADKVVTVQRVIPGSAAQDAGIRSGDQIIAVGGVPVTSVADFLEGAQTGRQINNTGSAALRRASEQNDRDARAARRTCSRRHDDLRHRNH